MDGGLWMNSNCLKCGGTGKLVDGKPCPDCSDELRKESQQKFIQSSVPSQYQDKTFDVAFVPMSEREGYGKFMDGLLTDIYKDPGAYQKNMLICSRPNSGKTIWAYTLVKILADKGYVVPPVLDLIQVRDALNYSTRDTELSESISKSRCLIVKIPADVTFWMIDIIMYILERRVPNNGFTIFLFNGNYEQLKQADKNKRLSHLRGDGGWHTIKVEDFNYE